MRGITGLGIVGEVTRRTIWTQPSLHGHSHSRSAQHVFNLPPKDPTLRISTRNASLWNGHNMKICPEKVKT